MIGKTVSQKDNVSDDILPQEVVDTFFGKSKNPDPPAEPDKQSKISSKKTEYKAIIVAVCFCIVLTAAFMIGYLVSSRSTQNVPSAQPEAPIVKEALPDYNKLVYDGLYDRGIVKNLDFEGDAKAKSQMLTSSMKLVNDASLGWARLSINFDRPVDLRDSNVMILAKSADGTKAIKLILGDIDNRSYEVPFIKYTSKWEWKTIALNNNLDLKHVKQLAIEYGSETVGNAGETSIYIKEIGIKKGGGI